MAVRPNSDAAHCRITLDTSCTTVIIQTFSRRPNSHPHPTQRVLSRQAVWTGHKLLMSPSVRQIAATPFHAWRKDVAWSPTLQSMQEGTANDFIHWRFHTGAGGGGGKGPSIKSWLGPQILAVLLKHCGQSGESMWSVLEKKEIYGGKDFQRIR